MPSPIEEKEAIRELMAEYCYRCDGRDPEGLAALFAPDGIWDGGAIGRLDREGLKALLLSATDSEHRMRHFTANEVIRVDGDRATATCYFMVVKVGTGMPEVQFAGFYDDRLVKRNGRWLFQERVTRGS